MAVALGLSMMVEPLGMAQAQGFLTQETDHIASSVKVEAGEVRLNGKTIQMPKLGAVE